MPIESHDFFTPFSDTACTDLLTHSEHLLFDRNECIFDEGDPSDAVYLVETGEVELRKDTPEKEHEILARIFSNDYFGEMGVIDGEGRSASAHTVTASRLLRIPSEALMDVLNQEPSSVSLELFRRISSRLRHTNASYMSEVFKKEKMHLLGEMARSMIHDFRSPLTGILLAIDLIRDDRTDESIEENVQLIKSQIKRMNAMTLELLEFARGEGPLNKIHISVQNLFDEVLLLNKTYLDQHKIQLINQGIPDTLELDRDRFLRVLQNLINNAAQAMSPEGGEIRLEAFRRDTCTVEIRVADNGPGIPEEIRDNVFAPFITAGQKGGLGLGMSIVKNIVEAHHGDISFRTETDLGTTFIITLPA